MTAHEVLEIDPASPRYIRTEPWVDYRFSLDHVSTKRTGAICLGKTQLAIGK